MSGFSNLPLTKPAETQNWIELRTWYRHIWGLLRELISLNPEGVISVQSTAVGNIGAGEDNLMSYSLAANSFRAAGKYAHVTAYGTFANNVNAKTLRLYWGSTAILTQAFVISIASTWRIEADIVSTGTDTQDYCSQFVAVGTAGAALNDLENGTSAQDDGAAILIRCTGTAVADNDIIQEGMIVRFTN